MTTPTHPLAQFVHEYAAENEVELLLLEGFDDAIVGLAHRAGSDAVVAYDIERCTRVLVERDGMDPDEAAEYLDFNVVSAYVGELTPVFLTRPENPPPVAYSSVENRVRQLMTDVGMPDSLSLFQAFMQLAGELLSETLR